MRDLFYTNIRALCHGVLVDVLGYVDTLVHYIITPIGILKDTRNTKHRIIEWTIIVHGSRIYSALLDISTQHIHVSSDSVAYRISSLVH